METMMTEHLTPNTYQERCSATAIYPSFEGVPYTILGLTNEAGEVAGKYKKYLRDRERWPDVRDKIAEELGDVLWYAAMLARELGYPLEEIMRMNLDKLAGRAERGTIGGSGDKR